MAENENLTLEYAIWVVPSFQIGLPLNVAHFFPSSQHCRVCGGPAAYRSAISAGFLQSCIKPYFPKHKVDFIMLLVQK